MALEEHPRTVLGPVPCQACHELVVWEMQGDTALGWLHADGNYTCRHRPSGLSKREYNRRWMATYRLARRART